MKGRKPPCSPELKLEEPIRTREIFYLKNSPDSVCRKSPAKAQSKAVAPPRTRSLNTVSHQEEDVRDEPATSRSTTKQGKGQRRRGHSRGRRGCMKRVQQPRSGRSGAGQIDPQGAKHLHGLESGPGGGKPEVTRVREGQGSRRAADPARGLAIHAPAPSQPQACRHTGFHLLNFPPSVARGRVQGSTARGSS